MLKNPKSRNIENPETSKIPKARKSRKLENPESSKSRKFESSKARKIKKNITIRGTSLYDTPRIIISFRLGISASKEIHFHPVEMWNWLHLEEVHLMFPVDACLHLRVVANASADILVEGGVSES